MSNYTFEVIEELPPLTRGGSSRNAEERNTITAMLLDGKNHKLNGVETDQEYKALQQRIRGYAQRAGVKVEIRKTEEGLAFTGTQPEVVKEKKK